MKRLMIFASMLALSAGCATNQNAGAPESNLPPGEAYLYPEVPVGSGGREGAAISPPIITDSGYVYTGTAASTASAGGTGAAVTTEEPVTATSGDAAGGTESVIPLGTTIYSFGNGAAGNAAAGSPAVTTTTSTGAAAGSASTTPTTEKDQRFVRDASQGAKAQITLGQMIVQKSSNPDMQALGQRLINDNTQAYQQLSQIAMQKNIAIASTPSDRMQESLDRISSHADFDEQSVRNARRGAGRQADLYTWASNSAQDPDLRGFAQQNVSLVQQDHAQAQHIEDSMGLHH